MSAPTGGADAPSRWTVTLRRRISASPFRAATSRGPPWSTRPVGTPPATRSAADRRDRSAAEPASCRRSSDVCAYDLGSIVRVAARVSIDSDTCSSTVMCAPTAASEDPALLTFNSLRAMCRRSPLWTVAAARVGGQSPHPAERGPRMGDRETGSAVSGGASSGDASSGDASSRDASSGDAHCGALAEQAGGADRPRGAATQVGCRPTAIGTVGNPAVGRSAHGGPRIRTLRSRRHRRGTDAGVVIARGLGIGRCCLRVLPSPHLGAYRPVLATLGHLAVSRQSPNAPAPCGSTRVRRFCRRRARLRFQRSGHFHGRCARHRRHLAAGAGDSAERAPGGRRSYRCWRRRLCWHGHPGGRRVPPPARATLPARPARHRNGHHESGKKSARRNRRSIGYGRWLAPSARPPRRLASDEPRHHRDEGSPNRSTMEKGATPGWPQVWSATRVADSAPISSGGRHSPRQVGKPVPHPDSERIVGPYVLRTSSPERCRIWRPVRHSPAACNVTARSPWAANVRRSVAPNRTTNCRARSRPTGTAAAGSPAVRSRYACVAAARSRKSEPGSAVSHAVCRPTPSRRGRPAHTRRRPARVRRDSPPRRHPTGVHIERAGHIERDVYVRATGRDTENGAQRRSGRGEISVAKRDRRGVCRRCDCRPVTHEANVDVRRQTHQGLWITSRSLHHTSCRVPGPCPRRRLRPIHL